MNIKIITAKIKVKNKTACSLVQQINEDLDFLVTDTYYLKSMKKKQ